MHILVPKQTSENENGFRKPQDYHYILVIVCFYDFSRKNENRENTLVKVLRFRYWAVLAIRE